jgi:hypothetical protein
MANPFQGTWCVWSYCGLFRILMKVSTLHMKLEPSSKEEGNEDVYDV